MRVLRLPSTRYITEKSANNGINIWFWAMNDASVPASVLNGASTIKISDLGEPYANFPYANCNYNSYFGPEAIIINLTLCASHRPSLRTRVKLFTDVVDTGGDWAGNVYPSTCPKTCVGMSWVF